MLSKHVFVLFVFYTSMRNKTNRLRHGNEYYSSSIEKDGYKLLFMFYCHMCKWRNWVCSCIAEYSYYKQHACEWVLPLLPSHVCFKDFSTQLYRKSKLKLLLSWRLFPNSIKISIMAGLSRSTRTHTLPAGSWIRYVTMWKIWSGTPVSLHVRMYSCVEYNL